MRILIITNFYPPFERGGGEDVAVVSAKAFRDLGHDVFIMTATSWQGWRSLLPRKTIEDGITVFRYFPLNIYFLGNASKHHLVARMIWTVIDLFNPVAWLQAHVALARARANIVITHNIKGMGLWLPRIIVHTGVIHAHVIHDVQLVEPSGLLYERNENSDTWWRAFYSSATRCLFSPVTRLISPSKFLFHFYTSREFFFHAKTYPLLNPVSSKRVAPVTHQGVNVIFIGQFEIHKGIRILLSSWVGLGDPQKQLHFYGDGTLRAEIEKAAIHDSSINVHTKRVREEQNDVWRTADIIVVPSLCLENSPSIITEALYQGVSVIASSVGGIPELASRSSGLHLVPAGNVEALRSELRNLMSKPVSRAPIELDDGVAYVNKLLPFLLETGPAATSRIRKH